MKKKVSVIIPTFNKSERLELALESFCFQTFDDFEIIVVDDGSEAPVKGLIDIYRNKIDIQYVYINNSGRSVARNIGAQHAKGDIIIFTDDDLIVSQTFVASHSKLHEQYDKCIVHGRIYNLPFLKFFRDPQQGELLHTVSDQQVNIDFLTKYLIHISDIKDLIKIDQQKRLTQFEKLIKSSFDDSVETIKWISFTGGNVSCKKQHFLGVKGFDETLGLTWGCEDLELGYRFYKNNFRFVYSESAYNYHMAHARMTFESEIMQAKEQFYAKHKDMYIKCIHQLLLGEFKSAKKYVEYINAKIKEYQYEE